MPFQRHVPGHAKAGRYGLDSRQPASVVTQLPLPLSLVPERFTAVHGNGACSFGAPHIACGGSPDGMLCLQYGTWACMGVCAFGEARHRGARLLSCRGDSMGLAQPAPVVLGIPPVTCMWCGWFRVFP